MPSDRATAAPCPHDMGAVMVPEKSPFVNDAQPQCPLCGTGMLAAVTCDSRVLEFHASVSCGTCGWNLHVVSKVRIDVTFVPEVMAQRVLDDIQLNVSFHRNHWRC